jgi:HK97 family phage portal protein
MGLANLLRSTIPRGTRDPAKAPWPAAHGPWWGPWSSLPWASDGSMSPTVQQTYGDAEAATLAIPAAWRATNLIAGFIAQMPLSAYDDTPPKEIDASKQLLNDPWPAISYYNWMFGCAASLVLRGNFYGVKADFDESTGNPRQIIPINNDDVTVNYEKGVLTYDIVGMPRSLSWLEVFHVRGFMLPGMLTGVGVIEAHRAGLAATRQLMDYGTGAYASGGVPPVVMRVDKPELSEQEAEYLQNRWVQRHGAHDRRPAVIPKIVEIEKVGLSMQDAEYLESRQFSIAEIAYMFNLDPEDLSASLRNRSGRIEYQNIEAKMRDRLIFSLQMWMSRIEQAFRMDLPGAAYARFNTNELFRADSLTRMRTYDLALKNNIYTLEEIRIMENMPVDDYTMQTLTGELDTEAPKQEDALADVPAQLRPFVAGSDEIPVGAENATKGTVGGAQGGEESGEAQRDWTGKFAPSSNGGKSR